MVYRTPYSWNIKPPNTDTLIPVHGISNHLSVVSWTPTNGKVKILPMEYRTPYPWYIEPPTHGILNPYPWYIEPPTYGILTPLWMVFWTPYPCYFKPPSMEYRTPYPWYIEHPINGILNTIPMVFWPPLPRAPDKLRTCVFYTIKTNKNACIIRSECTHYAYILLCKQTFQIRSVLVRW